MASDSFSVCKILFCSLFEFSCLYYYWAYRYYIVFPYVYIKQLKPSKILYELLIIIFVLINTCSFYIYGCAGVMRDAPELNIIKGQQVRGMHARYNDKDYQYDKDFTTSKLHWLVIGNSYGRNWVNILLESSDSIEISYLFDYMEDKVDINKVNSRIVSSDVVFYSKLGVTEENIKQLQKILSCQTKLISSYGEELW